MTALIGIRRDSAHVCGKTHLPNCFNPGLNLTACVCGAMWWRGQVGVWRSRQIRRQVGETIGGNPIHEVEAWDRYFLHEAGCISRAVNPAAGHRCTDVAPMTAAEAFGHDLVEVVA